METDINMSRFHRICGEDVSLSEDGTIAQITGSMSLATGFFSDPLRRGETFAIRVKKVGVKPEDASLYLGIKDPQEWINEGRKHPKNMTHTWLIGTSKGRTWIHRRQADCYAEFKESTGLTNELCAGDIWSVTNCGDRSLSIAYNDAKFTNVLTDLPEEPIWVAIGVGVIELEILQTERRVNLQLRSDNTVHVFDIARRFVNMLQMPAACFIPQFDVCFCEACHASRGDKLVYTRGNPPSTYGLPIGWCKFGLETKPQAKAYEIFRLWHVAFHGTRVDALEKIIETGDLLIPGDTTPGGQMLTIPKGHWNPDHENPKLRPPPGHDVKKFYFSPSIKYSGSEVYAPKHNWVDQITGDEHQIRVAFQVRIKPGVYDVGEQTIGARGTIDPLFPNKQLEWSTSRRGVAILVGLLVKVEDMVGNRTISQSNVEENPTTQTGIEGSVTFMAEFKRDYIHETTNGTEIELKAGDKCWVIHREGEIWQILHANVNEPINVMAHQLRQVDGSKDTKL